LEAGATIDGMAGIHPDAAIDDADARSRNRNGGFWRKQTFNLAVVNDRVWSSAAGSSWDEAAGASHCVERLVPR